MWGVSACVWRWEGEGVKREGVLNQFYSHETVPLILKQLRFENVFFSRLAVLYLIIKPQWNT